MQTRAQEIRSLDVVKVQRSAGKTGGGGVSLSLSRQGKQGHSIRGLEYTKAESTGTFKESVVVWCGWEGGCRGVMVEDGAGRANLGMCPKT